MNTLSPLYFPDSVIDTSIRLSLASCFHRVQLLKPVEETDTPPSPQIIDPFTENDFCQVHIPCPLAEEDRNGFLHMIKDIRTQGDAFVNQLKMMTIASMSSSRQQNESSRSILSALFPSRGNELPKEDETIALELWQARLVLKLAEIIDEEELSLTEQLGSIDELGSEMLTQLRGNRDTDSADPLMTEPVESHGQPNPATTGNRMKAWTTLYRYWDSIDIPVWVSARQEAADILFEKYEKMCGTQPLQFLQIALPIAGRTNKGDFGDRIILFRKETEFLRAQTADLFSQLLKREIRDHLMISDRMPDTSSLNQQWLETINHHFPEKEYGRAVLTSHLLSGIPFGKLIDKKRGSQSPFGNAILSVIDNRYTG